MPILPALATQLQCLFPATDKGQERWRWFMLTLQAILVPITASRTSNLLRAIATLFGVQIGQSPYYAFMASVKLRWKDVWEVLWRAIPDPLTDGRLMIGLDDSVNAKTGRKVFACQRTFDHAAKTNQSQYPWAQTIVTVGLLKKIHGRWSCLPLAFAFYFRLQTLGARCIRVRGEAVAFQTKFAQAVRLIGDLAKVFATAPVLVVADSWFGNNGLLTPRTQKVTSCLIGRLRSIVRNLCLTGAASGNIYMTHAALHRFAESRASQRCPWVARARTQRRAGLCSAVRSLRPIPPSGLPLRPGGAGAGGPGASGGAFGRGDVQAAPGSGEPRTRAGCGRQDDDQRDGVAGAVRLSFRPRRPWRVEAAAPALSWNWNTPSIVCSAASWSRHTRSWCPSRRVPPAPDPG
jgi:hypothetical protein